MRIGFFMREALRSMRRNGMPTFAALATVLVTMLVLGVFIPVVQATTGAANEVRGKLLLDVYLRTGASSKDISRVEGILLNKTKHVKRVQYISKTQAYHEERKRFPTAYEALGTFNPLPDTFRVIPDKAQNIAAIRNELDPIGVDGHRRPIDSAISQVKNRQDETNKILTATRVVKLTVGLLAALLITASILLIANTIRLSLFARRREVEVMKLVGATDWFIRWPFVIEGVIVGALGGVFAVVLLGIGKVALIDPLEHQFALISAPSTINFALLVMILLAASVGLAAVGSGISLRRFLRV